ncbi:hypothetical protein PNEG_01812 [Pneumocystis murina B123]|uniref:Peroxin/Ferlin domain-containing protein n=1 Tax=Pneumocystis murina (strain B123) TaxID=1069680 RepID=M7NSG3_PNEMU|nr:hypothetical protein PNEG_01812 [Pneumocystis murina B123]EMR10061.1 hypothetical protein PNEG_01812 [Pneumocystis murina B123]
MIIKKKKSFLKIPKEQVLSNGNLHQIELKDQRYDYERIQEIIRPCGDNMQFKGLNKVDIVVFEYDKDENNECKNGKKNTVVDVLYENQRGISLCGTLIFSANSLFFFDPSPWTDKNFRYSPVNIFTATCPDPSWRWTWDKWRIDMYGNVDPDGWSYSFSFKSKRWYGTSIWFHSFVRRRKWVRQRQCCFDDPRSEDDGNYFTISSSYDPSRSLISTISPNKDVLSVSDNSEDDISVHDLLKRLRESRIDRERLHILKNFIIYNNKRIDSLKDLIKDILDCFIFQESRRQLLAFLIKMAKGVQTENYTLSDFSEETKKETNKDNIFELIDLIKKEIHKYEFWEDK